MAKGETLSDHELAVAQGPIMIGTPAKPKDPKVGRVLGGGRVKKEYPYTLVIKENRESYYTAKMLETVVNTRFHQTEDGHQKGVATGKTASYLVLKVPELYHQNQERFFRVVQLLPMIDGPELRARRLAAWSKELLDPKTAGVAALKLEGLGNASVEPLKEGLKSPNDQVKFFSAEALAYLNDTAGVETLGDTVIRQPEFRAYALAALASLDQSASHMKLRKLMDEADIEVRYGAFNALRTLDPPDSYLGRVRVLDDPKPDEDEERRATRWRWRSLNPPGAATARSDPFALYIVDSEGPPLVHVSRTRRTEIVIFGRQQKLLPPIVLDGGEILFNAGDNDDKVELSKIVVARRRRRHQGHELAGAGRRDPPGRQHGGHLPPDRGHPREGQHAEEPARPARRGRGAGVQPGLSRSHHGPGHPRQARRRRRPGLRRGSTRPRWRLFGPVQSRSRHEPRPQPLPSHDRRPRTDAQPSPASRQRRHFRGDSAGQDRTRRPRPTPRTAAPRPPTRRQDR